MAGVSDEPITLESHKIIVKCLKSLLNNNPISVVLESYLEQVCAVTSSKYGLIGQRMVNDNGVFYRYYGILGMPKSSPYYQKYIEDGYYDDTSHNMYADFTDGKPSFHNDLVRSRGKPYPPEHPEINKVIFIPLVDNKGHIIGVLGLAGDNNYTNNFVVKHQRWIELSSIFLQMTLERVMLMRSRDNFLANISHELRTPLSGIMCVNNMIMGMNLPPEIKHHIEIIETCCNQLLDLTNDILDYTNITSGKLLLKREEISIVDIASTLQILVKDKIQPGVNMEFVIDQKIPKLMIGDRTRIIQLAMNILDNSSKFTKEGYIKTTISYMGLKNDMHNIKFIIEDTGCGIDSYRIDHIFDMVNNFNPSYLSSQCGVGLGLPITRHIVELYHGKITLDSELNIGTTITFNLELGNVEDTTEITEMLKQKDVLLYISNYKEQDTLFDFFLDMGARPQLALDEGSFKKMLKRHGSSYNFALIVADDNIVMDADIDIYIVQIDAKLGTDEIKKGIISDLRKSNSKDKGEVNIANIIKQHTDNRRKHYRVLIAEDNAQNMEVFIMLLVSMGYEHSNITRIENGDKLYKALINSNSHFDVAFVDLKMPILDGISAIKKYNKYISDNPESIAAQRRNRMLILATTASVSPQTRADCNDTGMNGYIQKPIRISDLENVDLMLSTIS